MFSDSPQNKLTAEYLEHEIFSKLQTYIEFYDSLSFSVMHWISSGTTTLFNLDTYVLSSIQGTLESIKLILKAGRINDSYALVRKFHDSAIINAYEIAYLEEHFGIETFIVEKIDNWVKGTEKLPDYKTMMKYLSNNERIKETNFFIEKDDRYKKIRSRCNDHMHYNLFHYMLINDNQIYSKNRIKFLNQLSADLENLFILHFSYLFTLRPNYMASSDYMDAMDCGLTPEENSQYFVAPFVQNAFDSIIRPRRNDIAELLKKNCGMQLD